MVARGDDHLGCDKYAQRVVGLQLNQPDLGHRFERIALISGRLLGRESVNSLVNVDQTGGS